MKEKKFSWGELAIPAMAVAYSLYAIVEQTTGNLETRTVVYSMFLVAPIFICTFIVVFKVLRTKSKIETSDEKRRQSAKGRKNILLFLIWAALFVASVSVLGYFIAIFIYLGVFLWALGERPWYKVATFSAVAVVSIHFLFVKWIGLPLPEGLLRGIL